jgi:hypothetical protein
MRSSKLVPALAAASALLVLAPAGAAARPAALVSPLGGCRISLVVEPRTITAGEPVQLFGQLLCRAGSNANQTITLLERPIGTSTWKPIGEPKTTAGGTYAMTVTGTTVDTAFIARGGGNHSGAKGVRVAPQVKLEGPPKGTELQIGRKNAVTFKGLVNPADVGAEVWFERETASGNEEWGLLQKNIIVGPGGVFTIKQAFGAPGGANFRAIVRPHGIFKVRGISEVLGPYVIAQPQNPNLTINSSADPISFGAPITIEGVLNGGGGKPVQLSSHQKGSSVFTSGPSTPAGPKGEYKFTVTPGANTFYRVTGGGQTSRALYEGVKYVLTAGASPTTVQSGQMVTFSGTVTPAHKGKHIYLERENLFGGGFHVVDIGTVTEAGTYSIKHVVFGLGKGIMFRVHVPGDADNASVASTPFTVEVTLAPPGALHPVTPAKLPS